MALIATLAVALTMIPATFAQFNADECRYTVPGKHISYDLSSLHRPDGYYAAPENDESRHYLYYWNVCGKMNKAAFPPYASGVCDSKLDDMGAAYQIHNGTADPEDPGVCEIIGRAEQASFELIDRDNGGVGITLKYTGGSACGSKQRTFSIHYRCNQDIGSDFIISPVIESPTCEYQVTVQSRHGCPTQCQLPGGALCAGNGLCGIDRGLSPATARCYCYSGRGGNLCELGASKKEEKPASATPALVGVTITLIVVLIALAVLLVNRIKRLNSGDTNYGKMTDSGPVTEVRRPAPIAGAAEL